ncbi:MAG: DNA polymerase IV [Clostridium sp.]
MERTILHVDMDAFFASVEQRDNKELRGKPVIVGGVSERGVVSTCSYEARKYGIHSAMPAFMAREKCPHGIFVHVRYGRYKEVSEQVFKILSDVTSLVEGVSIDEAYLDITHSSFKSGMEAAQYIKKRVWKELGLTISVGISYNKFLAKLASDWNKPNGIKEIKKVEVPEILYSLPLRKVHGLGAVSVKKLNNMGFFKVEDLMEMPKVFFKEYLGKFGLEIYDRIRGIDTREVNVERIRKSIGKERTLKNDTNDLEELITYLEGFAKEISYLMKLKNIEGKTVTLKYKTSSFQNHTRSKTLLSYVNSFEDIVSTAKELLLEEEIIEPWRLIGLSISSFKEEKVEQLTLF